MGAAMIDASTFIPSSDGGSDGHGNQSGTVEVTLHDKTRRVPAARNSQCIMVQNISGRLKGGWKFYNLRLLCRSDNSQEVEVHEHPAPNVEGKAWAELTFGSVLHR